MLVSKEFLKEAGRGGLVGLAVDGRRMRAELGKLRVETVVGLVVDGGENR